MRGIGRAPMTDAAKAQVWLDDARKGDALAVSKLLMMYHPLLRARLVQRMEKSLRARCEPEDILQQAYATAFQRIHSFEDRGPDSFRNWMLTIVDTKLADARRTAHRRRRDVSMERSVPALRSKASCLNLLDELYAHSTTPSHTIRRDEAVGALLACISQLSEAHREVIQLRYLEEQSVRHVAERLGKSEDAVKKLIRRGLAALRRLMDGVGDFTRGK